MKKQQEQRQSAWRDLIARQAKSGRSVRSSCGEHGVGEHSFYSWRRRLAAAHPPVRFALVETTPAPAVSSPPIELLLSSGERLRVSPGTDPAMLRMLLGLLRETA